jgi:hypothetical protein
MTIRTQTVSSPEMFTKQERLKVAELGGKEMAVDLTVSGDRVTAIRSWPSMESAQAWCDYMTTHKGVISAEILED